MIYLSRVTGDLCYFTCSDYAGLAAFSVCDFDMEAVLFVMAAKWFCEDEVSV